MNRFSHRSFRPLLKTSFNFGSITAGVAIALSMVVLPTSAEAYDFDAFSKTDTQRALGCLNRGVQAIPHLSHTTYNSATGEVTAYWPHTISDQREPFDEYKLTIYPHGESAVYVPDIEPTPGSLWTGFTLSRKYSFKEYSLLRMRLEPVWHDSNGNNRYCNSFALARLHPDYFLNNRPESAVQPRNYPRSLCEDGTRENNLAASFKTSYNDLEGREEEGRVEIEFNNNGFQRNYVTYDGQLIGLFQMLDSHDTNREYDYRYNLLSANESVKFYHDIPRSQYRPSSYRIRAHYDHRSCDDHHREMFANQGEDITENTLFEDRCGARNNMTVRETNDSHRRAEVHYTPTFSEHSGYHFSFVYQNRSSEVSLSIQTDFTVVGNSGAMLSRELDLDDADFREPRAERFGDYSVVAIPLVDGERCSDRYRQVVGVLENGQLLEPMETDRDSGSGGMSGFGDLDIGEMTSSDSDPEPESPKARFDGLETGDLLTYDGLLWMKNANGGICQVDGEKSEALENFMLIPNLGVDHLGFLNGSSETRIRWEDCPVSSNDNSSSSNEIAPELTPENSNQEQLVSNDSGASNQDRAPSSETPQQRFNDMDTGEFLKYNNLDWMKKANGGICLKKVDDSLIQETFERIEDLDFLNERSETRIRWEDCLDPNDDNPSNSNGVGSSPLSNTPAGNSNQDQPASNRGGDSSSDSDSDSSNLATRERDIEPPVTMTAEYRYDNLLATGDLLFYDNTYWVKQNDGDICIVSGSGREHEVLQRFEPGELQFLRDRNENFLDWGNRCE